MSWREDAFFKDTHIIRLFLGEGIGDLGVLVVASAEDLNILADAAVNGYIEYDIKGDILAENDTVVFQHGTDGADALAIADLRGDVQSADGTVVLDHGTDGTDAFITADVMAEDGSPIVLSGADQTLSEITAGIIQIVGGGYFIGDIQGGILAGDETAVLGNGTDGTDAWFTGDVRAQNGSEILVSGSSQGTSYLRSLWQTIDGSDIVASPGAGSLGTGWSKINLAAHDGTIVLDVGTDVTDGWFKGQIRAEDGSVMFEPGTDGTDAVMIGEIHSEAGSVPVFWNGTDGTDAWFKGDILSENGLVILTSGTTPVTSSLDVNTVTAEVMEIGSQNSAYDGKIIRKQSIALTGIAAFASLSIGVAVPAGSRLIGVQMRVDSALAGGDTWDAEWNDGGTIQSIATNQAVAKNTKVNKFFDPNANSPLTGAVTNIVLTKNGGGVFTAQGQISAIAYFEEFEDMVDAA